MQNSLLASLVIGMCLILAAFLSGMEAGVFALSRLRIRQYKKKGRQQARLLLRYLEEPENFLWTILIGNTLFSFVAVSLTVLELFTLLGDYPVALVAMFLVLAVLYYALVELLPKMIFRQYPNRLCIMLARPFRFVHVALTPVVFLVSMFANVLHLVAGGRTFTGSLFGDRNELRLLMQESANLLSSEERHLINKVLDLENLTVRSVSRPMDEVTTLTPRSTVDDVLRICRDTGLNRLPMWRKLGNKNRITGYVYLMPLLFQKELDRNRKASDWVRPLLHLKETTRLKDALRQMQERGQRLAVVSRRDGRERGIISLQDILRVIFGEVDL